MMPPIGSLGASTLRCDPVVVNLTSVCLPRYSPSTSMGTSRSEMTLHSAAWMYSTDDLTRSRTPAMPFRVSTTNLYPVSLKTSMSSRPSLLSAFGKSLTWPP